ncbi:hypothetical protein KHV-MN_00163 [Cyprinid herpesvirus 3]|nr:ORF154L [Cyprinid herpesvirus 3]AVL28083.1 protein ORF154 [Cyprinid herpesvirus 3]QQZ02242.1 hypothetical protein KHV-MN_00163 [Cyprinid herpesvirus 3]
MDDCSKLRKELEDLRRLFTITASLMLVFFLIVVIISAVLNFKHNKKVKLILFAIGTKLDTLAYTTNSLKDDLTLLCRRRMRDLRELQDRRLIAESRPLSNQNQPMVVHVL